MDQHIRMLKMVIHEFVRFFEVGLDLEVTFVRSFDH